ncbi:MAG: MFS transporter [Ilumatobacteraceae bacterium]
MVFTATALFVATGAMTVPLTMVCGFLAICAPSMLMPLVQALVPSVSPPEQLMQAVALQNLSMMMSTIGGIFLGGVVMQIFGTAAGFWLLVVASCLGLLVVSRAPLPDRLTGAAALADRCATASVSKLGTEPLRSLLATTGVLGIAIATSSLLLPEFARDVLGKESLAASALNVAMSIGMMITSMLLATRWTPSRPGLLLAAFTAVPLGGGLIAIGLSREYVVTALCGFAWGLTGGVAMTLLRTLTQQHTPPELMGRVMGLVAMAQNGVPDHRPAPRGAGRGDERVDRDDRGGRPVLPAGRHHQRAPGRATAPDEPRHWCRACECRRHHRRVLARPRGMRRDPRSGGRGTRLRRIRPAGRIGRLTSAPVSRGLVPMSAPDAVGDTRFMPTASEFRTIAATLDACRDEVVGLATALHSLPTDGALTGPVRTAVGATVGVTLANLRAVDADLAERAAERDIVPPSATPTAMPTGGSSDRMTPTACRLVAPPPGSAMGESVGLDTELARRIADDTTRVADRAGELSAEVGRALAAAELPTGALVLLGEIADECGAAAALPRRDGRRDRDRRPPRVVGRRHLVDDGDASRLGRRGRRSVGRSHRRRRRHRTRSRRVLAPRALMPLERAAWQQTAIPPGCRSFGPGAYYTGGGAVRGPDGRIYPIVVPHVVRGDDHFTIDADLPDHVPSAASLDGRDSGWTVVAYRTGVEQIHADVSGFWQGLSAIAFATGLPSGGHVDDRHLASIEFRLGGRPAFGGTTAANGSGGSVATAAQSIEPHTGPVVDGRVPGRTSTGRPRSMALPNPPASPAVTARSNLTWNAASLVVNGLQGVQVAVSMNDANHRAYEVVFEEHPDGRLRSRVQSFALEPRRDGVLLSAWHLFVADDGRLTQTPARYQAGATVGSGDDDEVVAANPYDSEYTVPVPNPAFEPG